MTVNTHPEGIALDPSVAMVDREDLARLWQSINDLTENERFLLRRWIEGVPIADQVLLGGTNPAERTLPGPGAQERFQGVAVFNYGGSPVNVGFSAGAALGLPLYRCPPETLLVIPVNYQDLSVAVTGSAQAALTVCRLRIAPLAPAAYPLNGGIEQGGLADSVMTTGSAAAPAAGATIAALPASQLPAGVYAVQVTTYETGTVDANPANMVLKKGATSLGALPSTAVAPTLTRERVTLDGQTVLQVTSGAAVGGAGSVYVASIAATQIA